MIRVANLRSCARISGESCCSPALDLPSAEFQPIVSSRTRFVTRYGFEVVRGPVKGLKIFSCDKLESDRWQAKTKGFSRNTTPLIAVRSHVITLLQPAPLLSQDFPHCLKNKTATVPWGRSTDSNKRVLSRSFNFTARLRLFEVIDSIGLHEFRCDPSIEITDKKWSGW